MPFLEPPLIRPWHEQPTGASKQKRKLALSLVALVAIVALVATAVVKPYVRRKVEAKLSRLGPRLGPGFKLAYGAVDVHLLSGSVVVRDVKLSLPRGGVLAIARLRLAGVDRKLAVPYSAGVTAACRRICD